MKMNKIIKFRQKLHQNPELSGVEFNTAKGIEGVMLQFKPDRVIKIGKTGQIFLFESGKPGKTIVFRADIDALPIQERNSFNYASAKANIAHLCGHDGHTSILLAFAERLTKKRPKKGTVALLFQPAEETGQGAKEIVESKEFKTLNPDYVFGLHNIPGADRNEVLIKKGSFAAASKGMIVKFFGKTSHAAEPENGINPAVAISKIIAQTNELIKNKESFKSLTLLTVIHVLVGEIAFGTSPGYAEIRFTLRAFENEDIELLTKKAEEIVIKNAEYEQLTYDISFTEVFPATVNDDYAADLIINSAKAGNYAWREIERPFKWSEDFGYYTENYKGAFFGLGAGKNHPALHNPDYDFPDELIESGADLFEGILNAISTRTKVNYK